MQKIWSLFSGRFTCRTVLTDGDWSVETHEVGEWERVMQFRAKKTLPSQNRHGSSSCKKCEGIRDARDLRVWIVGLIKDVGEMASGIAELEVRIEAVVYSAGSQIAPVWKFWTESTIPSTELRHPKEFSFEQDADNGATASSSGSGSLDQLYVVKGVTVLANVSVDPARHIDTPTTDEEEA
ncbi:hypothetical protein ON010_g18595 [Phytophthora cinnamomi]|nr:hypothetical protein ON010_g18595 [Phytophthora cinnamomi]